MFLALFVFSYLQMPRIRHRCSSFFNRMPYLRPSEALLLCPNQMTLLLLVAIARTADDLFHSNLVKVMPMERLVATVCASQIPHLSKLTSHFSAALSMNEASNASSSASLRDPNILPHPLLRQLPPSSNLLACLSSPVSSLCPTQGCRQTRITYYRGLWEADLP